MAERRCPACGGLLEPGDDTIAPNMWGCSACNLHQREAPVGVDDAPTHSAADVSRLMEARRAVFGTLLDGIDNERSTATIVDIGAGHGGFLALARQRGWRPFGVELDEATIRASHDAAGLHLTRARASALPIRPQTADVVTFWDSLDIVGDPALALANAFEALRPGGLLFGRVRNGPLHGAMRRCPLIPDRLSVVHTTLFSARSLRKALERRGFTEVRVELAVMTRNDPYESGSVRVPWFQVFKRVWGTLVRMLARYSDNRILVGPSLQAFARRPTK